MRVADIMTTDVITERLDAIVRGIAGHLLERGISAMPVIDGENRPVWIVSEGNLLRRVETGTATKQSWWLNLSNGADAKPERFAKKDGHRAEQVMSRELVTTTEDVRLADVGRLLGNHRVKHLRVLRDGRLVGIVSRANILRALVTAAPQIAARSLGGDRDIRKAVLDRLSDAGIAPGLVDATVKDGRVQLWGVARNDAEERAAIVAAGEVAGVVAAESNLGRVPAFA